MAEAQVVGNVVYVSGQVLARNADGELRVLKVGDTVLEGEVIITGPGARVELSHADGATTLVPEDSSVLVAADIDRKSTRLNSQ